MISTSRGTLRDKKMSVEKRGDHLRNRARKEAMQLGRKGKSSRWNGASVDEADEYGSFVGVSHIGH